MSARKLCNCSDSVVSYHHGLGKLAATNNRPLQITAGLIVEELPVTEPAHFVSIDNGQFVKKATEIVEKAQARGVSMRILGALAVYIHCLDIPHCIETHKALDRNGEGKPMFTDLDFLAYKKQSRDVAKILQEAGFKADPMVAWWFGDRMMIYEHAQTKLHVDVFLNKLEYSHDVLFGEKPGSGRLELDSPTISLEDLVLEKLQPNHMGRKDAIDLIVLFMGHEVREQHGENIIDGTYIAKVLSDDWGFWYDLTTNLEKVRSLARELRDQNRLLPEHCETVFQRTTELLRIIENAPKTKKWDARAKVGTRKPWFRSVEELKQS